MRDMDPLEIAHEELTLLGLVDADATAVLAAFLGEPDA